MTGGIGACLLVAGFFAASQAGAAEPPPLTPKGLSTRVQFVASRQSPAVETLPPISGATPVAHDESRQSTTLGYLASPELAALEAEALAANPELEALRMQASAAWAKVRSVDKPPDPSISANIFAAPIETAAGSQQANLSVAQMIPWFGKLQAQSRQAAFEAMAVQQMLARKRLAVIADVRRGWIQLYVIDQEIAANAAVGELLETLSAVATARISTGGASPGDALLANLQLARLQEMLIELQTRRAAAEVELNRVLYRPVETPIAAPRSVASPRLNWSQAELRDFAWSFQPEAAAAELRAQATRWGVEVARLNNRPTLSASAGWYAIDDNRPPSPIVTVGQDAWSVGVGLTIPLWQQHYRAAQREAASRHYASHADADAVRAQIDARIGALLAAARSAYERIELYEEAIMPQTEQVLAADQQALSQGAVTFERVLADARAVLEAQVSRQRALSGLATAVANLAEAVGGDEGMLADPSGMGVANELE